MYDIIISPSVVMHTGEIGSFSVKWGNKSHLYWKEKESLIGINTTKFIPYDMKI